MQQDPNEKPDDIAQQVDAVFAEAGILSDMFHNPNDTPPDNPQSYQPTTYPPDPEERRESAKWWGDIYAYLRPNRYFKFYLLSERNGTTTCWLPEGFTI
ncbi:MAG: hypothetical protein KKC75_05150 [Nanoarchaeota archaeon]|nr:hypothetical protein [Nanoarchaeota archaeon]MBU1004841.1 hypothetical protein [Nanoarchaeota archaeon]MBU1946779.1 hypothetical protein [Nanoarchaeota archaeon]